MTTWIVVAGANGHIGVGICGALAGRTGVVALVKSPNGANKAKSLGTANVHIFHFDEPTTLKDVFVGADAFRLVTMGENADRETNSLQAAHDAGITKAVKPSSGAVSLAEGRAGPPSAVAAVHAAAARVTTDEYRAWLTEQAAMPKDVATAMVEVFKRFSASREPRRATSSFQSPAAARESPGLSEQSVSRLTDHPIGAS